MINLRSSTDIQEVWNQIINGTDVTLWCDGLSCHERKRQAGCDEDEDNEDERPSKKRRQEDKEEKVQALLDDLKKKHGEMYSQMQYHIWSEMVYTVTSINHQLQACLKEQVVNNIQVEENQIT